MGNRRSKTLRCRVSRRGLYADDALENPGKSPGAEGAKPRRGPISQAKGQSRVSFLWIAWICSICVCERVPLRRTLILFIRKEREPMENFAAVAFPFNSSIREDTCASSAVYRLCASPPGIALSNDILKIFALSLNCFMVKPVKPI